jgi:hypothetical protein
MIAMRGWGRDARKLLVDGLITTTKTRHNQELRVLFSRAAVDLSRSMLNYVSGLIGRHRKKIGSAWRLLNPGQQALVVVVYLRKDETFTEIGAGLTVSATTAWRYVEETVMLLSARSPKLAQAIHKAARDGLTHVILDGTLIPTDRVKADRPHFSGKHRVHGMNVQVIAGPDGTILWTSGGVAGLHPRPDRRPDLGHLA